MLIQKGYSRFICETDSRGSTPVHYAAEWGAEQCLQFMLEALAIEWPDKVTSTVTALDERGFSAIHYACSTAEGRAILPLLIERGADPSIGSRHLGWTPLHYAVLENNIPAIEILLDKSLITTIDIDKADSNGNTPLHLAVWKNSARLVGILLEGNVGASSQGGIGLTPLQLGQEQRRYEAVQRLAGHSAKSGIPIIIQPVQTQEALLQANPAEARSFVTRRCEEQIPSTSPFYIKGAIGEARIPVVVSNPITGRRNQPIKSVTFSILSRGPAWISMGDKGKSCDRVRVPLWFAASVVKANQSSNLGTAFP